MSDTEGSRPDLKVLGKKANAFTIVDVAVTGADPDRFYECPCLSVCLSEIILLNSTQNWNSNNSLYSALANNTQCMRISTI